MEPNENQLNSYFHHLHHHHHQQHQHQHQHHHQSPTTSPTNGLLPATHHMSSTTATATATVDGGPHIVYPHSAPSAAAPLEPARRKRGRPRKYGTPEEALAAKKAATASSHSSSSKAKKEHRASSLNAASPSSPSFSASTKKSQFLSLGDPGHGFAPHVINVAAGEDVGQKIMLFLQQCKREICILSASGSISNASLRQPATSGGNITYEGRFEIVSLSGSYVNGTGGKTGGLSVCLSSADGHIVGGGVGGPLKAAGPVQVIIGTFVVDSKKEVGGGGVKGDASAGKLPSPVGGTSISGLRYGSTVDSSGGNHIRGNDDHQGIGESHFLLQSRGVNLTSPRPTDWRTCLDTTNSPAYDFSGRTGHHQSPENGDYDQIPD